MGAQSRARIACVDENTLAAFAEGQALAARASIEEHIADCADCRAVLARAAGLLRSHTDRSSARPGVVAVGSDAGETEAEPWAWEEFPAPELSPGTVVGRYIVRRLIGRGAMGTVYVADDPDLDRRVAVKLLRADALSEVARGQLRARLLREAKAMARLSHPEVITVYDVGAFGGQLFVAMEYVDGGTLRHWRSARHRGYKEVLAVYERAGSGLAAAHEAGLVHRDFKPDNVLVAQDGRVRVTDFGLARQADRLDLPSPPSSGDRRRDEGLASTLTRTGTLLGTPAYMAPEQLRGQPADARSDVFSFCVALYEALYGERPFPGGTLVELERAIAEGAVRSPPIMTPIPRWLRSTLLRGMRAAPEERFASMRVLLDALRFEEARWRTRVWVALAGAGGGLALVLAAGLHAGAGPFAALRAPAATQASTSTSVSPSLSASLSPWLSMLPLPAPAREAAAQAAFVASASPASPEPGATAIAAADLPPAPPAAPVAPRRAPPRAAPPAIPAAIDPAARPRPAPPVGNNGALILE